MKTHFWDGKRKRTACGVPSYLQHSVSRWDVTCANCRETNIYIHTSFYTKTYDFDELTFAQSVRLTELTNGSISQLSRMLRSWYSVPLDIREQVIVVLGYLGPTIYGWAVYDPTKYWYEDTPDCLYVYVDKKRRRLGIGTGLVKEVKKCFPDITFNTFPDKDGAKFFAQTL